MRAIILVMGFGECIWIKGFERCRGFIGLGLGSFVFWLGTILYLYTSCTYIARVYGHDYVG
jgi:hypothetical protein